MKQHFIQSALKEIVRVQGANRIIYAPTLGGLILFLTSSIDTMDILRIKGICEKWRIPFEVVE